MGTTVKEYLAGTCEDHETYADGLRTMLENESSLNIKIVISAADGKELLNNPRLKDLDLLLLDLGLPGMDGIEITAKVKAKYPHIKILILTMHKDVEYFKAVMCKQADGYVLKDDPKKVVVEALKDIIDGSLGITPELSPRTSQAKLADRRIALLEKLTAREIEVLQLISKKKTSKQIAKELRISIATVAKHRTRINEKLETKNKEDLNKLAGQLRSIT